jgi:hypothetical protein
MVEWIAFLDGPGRERLRTLWSLLTDAGTRRELTMYSDALQHHWERQVAARFGLTDHQASIAWSMMEGWVGRAIVRGEAMPSRAVLRACLRALLDVAPP